MSARAPTRAATLSAKRKEANRPSSSSKTERRTRAKAAKPEVRLFVSYSHRDAEARARLETHLAPLKRDGVETWFDGDLNAGAKLDTGIARAPRNAHVFVALLSPDYLASDYCWKIEYRRAMNRRSRGTIRVVAIIVRPCDWKSTPAGGFKLLPEDGREVTRWRSADADFLNVAQGMRRVVASVRKDMAATTQHSKINRAMKAKSAAKRPSNESRRKTTVDKRVLSRSGRKRGEVR